jgi:hypothetical protein
VQGQAAGRALGVVVGLGQRTDHGLQLGAGHGAGPQQADRAVEHGDDGAFQAHLARSAVQGGGALSPVSAKASSKVVGLGRPERLAEGATTGPPNAASTARDSGWPGTRMATVSSPARARSQTAAVSRIGATMVSGAGPERGGQGQGAVVEGGDARGGLDVVDVGDQRVEARTALGLEDRRHGRGVRGVGAQAIDGLGRQQHEPAVAPGPSRGGRYFFLAVMAKLTFTLPPI